MPIDLLAQSAALFCPYHFLKFNGAGGLVFTMMVLFQQPHAAAYAYTSLAKRSAMPV